ncbi:Phosphomannomutase [Anaerobranca californiensis DSM 14826]|uniref:Phosphoglucomutase n=1 Tax=Anaerobranca californiensis DSM 14826 TaxID=1120989 RepID=A0A1M6Q8S7_9FIRM|nr:phosphoglucomutase/phosphomannomutase family protein [Anaerobranca californiensis]SHK16694.1 Phosphomannomutase [Anaerobranca californiensis DSM 14826]
MTKIKFGTDGWRGILAQDFTFDNVEKVVKAILAHVHYKGMGNKGLVVGYDTRFLGEKFAELATKLANSWGINVYLTDKPTPTPVIAYGVKEKGAAGAIMFTASHNPPEYNGIKFIPHYAGPATLEITKDIEKHLHNPQDYTAEVEGERIIYNPWLDYKRHLTSLLDLSKLKGLKVVVDPMHGAGAEYLPSLLEEVGCEVIKINTNKDPYFGGSLPEPNLEHLEELVNKVKEEGAQLGLALDGDADRFGIVDHEGNYYVPNQLIPLLFQYLAEEDSTQNRVIRTVATTHLIDKMAAKLGYEVTETPVGFKYVGEAMEQGGVLIGGEESGGASIHGHIPEKDGILVDCLVALMVVKKGPLKDQWNNLLKEYGNFVSARLDLRVPEEKKESILNNLKENTPKEVAGLKVVSVNRIDGTKMLLEDGSSWVLFRPSGTEPLLRVYIESNCQDTFDKIAQWAKGYLDVE